MQTVFTPRTLLFAGIVLNASVQAASISASASANIVDPASVPTSLADLPVTISTSGGWIRVVIASAQPLLTVSNLSPGVSSSDSVVALSSQGGGALTLESFNQLVSRDGTVQGDPVIALSLLAPASDSADGGSFGVTVAFN